MTLEKLNPLSFSNSNLFKSYNHAFKKKESGFESANLDELFKNLQMSAEQKDALTQLYKRLEDLYKQLDKLMRRMEQTKDPEQKLHLLAQVQDITAQISDVMGQIMKILKIVFDSMKQAELNTSV